MKYKKFRLDGKAYEICYVDGKVEQINKGGNLYSRDLIDELAELVRLLDGQDK